MDGGGDGGGGRGVCGGGGGERRTPGAIEWVKKAKRKVENDEKMSAFNMKATGPSHGT